MSDVVSAAIIRRAVSANHAEAGYRFRRTGVLHDRSQPISATTGDRMVGSQKKWWHCSEEVSYDSE